MNKNRRNSPPCPLIRFFLASNKTPVTRNGERWNTRLPLSRTQTPADPSVSVTYGDYFTAAAGFFVKDRCAPVHRAVESYSGEAIDPEEIKHIDIFLEKHGPFYHPARIETAAAGRSFSFVLNVALTKIGRAGIKREFALLKRLGSLFQPASIPAVYETGEAVTAHGERVGLFLGEWFEGYNEFHISRDPTDGQDKPAVWDPQRGVRFLSSAQSIALYREIAFILTRYYNIETLEQIYPWHHAAGDFVVRIQKASLDVKLVTVRNYAPLFKLENGSGKKPATVSALLDGLLVFMLNMLLRIRLDRRDGTKEIVWAPDAALEGGLAGFWAALAQKPLPVKFPGPVADLFQAYLARLPAEELYDLCVGIVERGYSPEAPEQKIIQKNLAAHLASLKRRLHSGAYP